MHIKILCWNFREHHQLCHKILWPDINREYKLLEDILYEQTQRHYKRDKCFLSGTILS